MQQINVPKGQEKFEVPLKDIVLAKIDILRKNQILTIENKEIVCQELEIISSIIQDIHAINEKEPKCFNQLRFEYNSVKLSYQRYEIEEEISELNQISENINRNLIVLEEKQKDLKLEQESFQKNQKILENQYNKAEEKNNNLVYNLLGFLTAFSIVSAVVGVVSQINGVVNIMLFMTFTILLLLTTLIGLHNFYKNDNKRETKLQDNYFLWKIIGITFIFLIITSSIRFISENKENIFKYIDTKIEEIIEKKVTDKLTEN